jgi:hypothetical protein
MLSVDPISWGTFQRIFVTKNNNNNNNNCFAPLCVSLLPRDFIVSEGHAYPLVTKHYLSLNNQHKKKKCVFHKWISIFF